MRPRERNKSCWTLGTPPQSVVPSFYPALSGSHLLTDSFRLHCSWVPNIAAIGKINVSKGYLNRFSLLVATSRQKAMDAVTQMLPAFVFPDAPPKKIPNQTSRRLHSCASEFPPLFTLVLSLLSLHSFFEDYLMSQCNLLPSKVWSLMHDKCVENT